MAEQTPRRAEKNVTDKIVLVIGNKSKYSVAAHADRLIFLFLRYPSSLVFSAPILVPRFFQARECPAELQARLSFATHGGPRPDSFSGGLVF